MPADDIDALFEVPPGEFVRARDDLARRLRADKQVDEARAVRQLRRPTVVVWALNQVARQHPDEVEAVLAAAAEVGAAQRSGRGDRLREASTQLGARVGGLAALANESLGGEQKGSARRAEVEGAVRALALQGDATGEWRAGRLQQLLESATGEEMWAVGVAAVDEPQGARKTEAAPDYSQEELARAEAQRGVAQTDVDRARARLRRTESSVSDLETRLDEQRSVLAAAKSDLRSAEKRLREASKEVERLGRKRSR